MSPSEATHSESSLTFAFRGTRMLVRTDGASARLPADIGSGESARRLYLGTLDGRPCEAVELRDGPAPSEPLAFRDLRSLMGSLDEELLKIAGIASQVLDWDRNHQFCGRCGAQTVASAVERSRKCPRCSLAAYPRISPAIIVAVRRGREILLAHNRRHSGPVFSIVAGYVEPGESLEECVRRELREEVSIEVDDIRYFGSQPWPFPDSLMLGFVARYEAGEISVDGTEIMEAGWFTRETLPQIPPAGTIARRIIESVLAET